MTKTVSLFVAFVATVAAANLAVSLWGFWPVGFGLMAPAGTAFAGLAFILRDELQYAAGYLSSRRGYIVVLAAVALGAALSWWLASPGLAVASAIAFAASELVDLAVFTAAGQRLGARLWSNAIAAPVDTALFLWLSGLRALAYSGGGWPALIAAAGGQVLVKAIYLAPLAIVAWRLGERRSVLRTAHVVV